MIYCKYVLYNQGINMNFLWVPAQAGIEGNEIVDKLAKKLNNVEINPHEQI